MELDYQGMFKNKLVSPGEYMAKVVCVRAIKQSDGKEALEVEVVLDHNESRYDGTHLIAILNATPKGQRFIDAFYESYRVDRSRVQQAVGRWAAVYVYQSEFKGTHFGVAKFHAQPRQALEKIAEVEAEERESAKKHRPRAAPRLGLVEWNDEQAMKSGSTNLFDSQD